MNSPRLYFAHTMPGVEQIAWLEIRARLVGSRCIEFLFTKDQNGIVVFEYSGAPEDLLALRTTEDVFVLVASIEKLSHSWKDLREIADLIEHSRSLQGAANLVRQKGGQLTYRVISRKVGKHQYRRIDFQAAVIKGIERQFGDRWRLVDDDAQVEVWANAIGSRLLCGVRLSDPSMRHRGYQKVNLPASLRPSVAAAMVLLTQPDEQDVFMDPMCGCGTLVAERMLAGAYRAALGGDIAWDRVRASTKNLRQVPGRSMVSRWDAAARPVDTESVDKVAVNLPFGKQIGSRSEVEKLYPRFLAELERVLRPDGVAVLLTSEYDLLKDALRQHEHLRNTTGYSIAVLGQWARIYVLRKVGTCASS